MLLAEPRTLALALLLALAFDALAGDPPALWRRVPHPVVVVGRAITWFERRGLVAGAGAGTLRRRGRLATLAVVLAAALAGVILQALCLRLPWPSLWLGLLMSTLLAARGLHEHVARVADGLEQGLVPGRRAVAQIVGRDPHSLDREGVARAAVESTAENFADGVVAPLAWAALLGLPGMLAYKAVNTLDSMIGHRSERYLDYGRFAARLDDAASWLPARLAGLLLAVAAAVLPGCDGGAAWRCMARDARHHRSPNAGWPEAAMAGALGLRLAGPRRYGGALVCDAWMGDGRAAATPADIRRALRLYRAACALPALALALALLLLAP